MRFIPFVILFLCSSSHIVAQNDSSGCFDVYRNEVHPTLNPALTSDMGKHIIRTDVQFRRNNFTSNDDPFFYWQAAYSTQWRKHGFGIISKNVPSSQLVYYNAIGLQYAYGFGLGKNSFWKNTKLNMGVGLNMSQYKSNFDEYIFGDQINGNQGVVRNTTETPINGSYLYPTIDAGLTLRSPKFYLASTFYHINSIYKGFYQSVGSLERMNINIQTGAKLFELKKVSSWITYDLLIAENTDRYGQIGLNITYHHFIVSYKTRNYGTQLIQLSYIHPRLRVYAQYQNTPNEFVSYFNYGIFSTGIALGITKQ